MIDADYFDQFFSRACSHLAAGDELLGSVAGEDTDFVRFNHGAVRQAGSVSQTEVHLELIRGARHATASLPLALDPAIDDARVRQILSTLAEHLPSLPEDPFLLYNTEIESTEVLGGNDIPDTDAAIADIRSGADGGDLVGIYTAGETCSGFANSLGQRNWFQTSSFIFDWTMYLRDDKAAKNNYAGFQWDDDAFAAKVAWSKQQLAALERTPIDLAPGDYRTYLAPAAVQSYIELIGYYAFGEKSYRTMRSPLIKMVADGATLAAGTRIVEDTVGGTAPNFQEQGYLRPDEVVLVDGGAFSGSLVSPRTASEYDLITNGAAADESPQSLAIAPGSLAHDNAAQALDKGLYVGNLWYTNFSDRPACRVTGMTRFATFWVEGGEVVAPVNVLRFDDSIYRMFGSELVDFTDQAELILDASTYTARSNASFQLPGALLNELKFTL
ncbi:MAG: metallopeptidase TldD-related protein [Acidimicrobiales bacterium]